MKDTAIQPAPIFSIAGLNVLMIFYIHETSKVLFCIIFIRGNKNKWTNESQVLHIMLGDLLTQKCSQNFLVSDFRYPRACRFRKHQNLK
jgi:hypothetical protein